MSDNALFACGNGYCELSHPAEHLRVWKGTPYCQECYEDASAAETEPTWFADLPAFVPPYEREIAALEESRAAEERINRDQQTAIARLTEERDRLREAAEFARRYMYQVGGTAPADERTIFAEDVIAALEESRAAEERISRDQQKAIDRLTEERDRLADDRDWLWGEVQLCEGSCMLPAKGRSPDTLTRDALEREMLRLRDVEAERDRLREFIAELNNTHRHEWARDVDDATRRLFRKMTGNPIIRDLLVDAVLANKEPTDA